MKQVYALAIVILAVMSSCGGKKETTITKEQLMYQIDSVDQVTGIQRMQVSRTETGIEAGGRKYTLFIERAPSDSLPHVHTGMGVFADNRIVVRIANENGKRIFNKVFTKSSFSSFVNEAKVRSFMLEGVVYDEEKTKEAKGNIILASSIGYPQTDLYIPFTITITPDGKMSIKKNEDMFVHVDSRGKGMQVDVFFYDAPGSTKSKRLAQNFRRTFEQKYKRHQTDRGFSGTVSKRNLYVLRNTTPVCAFLELGNIANSRDQQRLVLDRQPSTRLSAWT